MFCIFRPLQASVKHKEGFEDLNGFEVKLVYGLRVVNEHKGKPSCTSMEEEEPNLSVLWDCLNCLVSSTSPAEANEVGDLRAAIRANLQKAVTALGFEDVHGIPRRSCTLLCGSDLIWDFVETALFVLSSLKDRLKDDDLSVLQQKSIRSCLQFLVSLGILPNILPGITNTTPVHGILTDILNACAVTELQKYERLCIVIKYLVSCCDSSTLRPLIISNAIHHLLGALLQLSYAPVKKPAQNACSVLPENGFAMTTELWNRLQDDQKLFRTLLYQLITETYQPKVMLELMLLQGNQKEPVTPLWLKKSSSKLLTSCLIQPGGVAALIRATLDSTSDTGSDWKKTDALAKIITSPVNHMDSIAMQIRKLMNVAANESHDVLPIVVACVQQLFVKDADICQKFIIDPLLQPLTYAYSNKNAMLIDGHILIPEDDVDCLVKQLHACFTTFNSKVVPASLPGSILLPFSSFFFKLFCRLYGSVSALCRFSEDILSYILCNNSQQALVKILKSILLEEEEDGIFVFPKRYVLNFGQSGGVCLEICSESSKDMFSSVVEDSGDMLMILLEKINDGELSVLVFEVLLKILVEKGMKPKSVSKASSTLETFEDTLANLMSSSEKHLGIVRLLAALVENVNVKQKLSEKPGPILAFIVTLFDSVVKENSLMRLEEEEDLECVFVAFMIINVMLDECENCDWSIFESLLQPVSLIRERTKNEELKRLASRVYNIISSCGTSEDKNSRNQFEDRKTKCEEALHDACDPILPVRGHALVQLTKLLQLRDHEALGKREAIFCLFKENLNHDDSYIYLASINGMVAFAAIQPNIAVRSLINEYIEISSAGNNSSRDPELRMKVGEILVKLVRELGGLAPKYRNEFLNAFLIGTKDVDYLMRASSLSNLGEVCQIFGFRVGPILRELLICITSILKFDEAIEPRRAAVMVVTHLLRGLDADTLHILEDAAVELYRTLKRVYCDDFDDVIRLHAQLALEELGRLAQNVLFCELPMEKKIQILS